MIKPAIAYATVVAVLVLACFQYMSTRRLSEVQKQYRRVADQADTIKAEERKIDSLLQQLQAQNGGLQERLKRAEGELRAQGQPRIETAVGHHPVALRIYPLRISPNGAVECSPTLDQTCDVFELGRDVHIGITLTNSTDHPITYPGWFGPPTFLVIRDKSGRLIPEAAVLDTLRDRYPPPNNTVLKPDGQVSWGVPVNQYWDMSRPGTYSIIAKLRSVERGQTWLYSNQIRVTIRSRL